MSYFLANLGRKHTSYRRVECLAGTSGLTGGPVQMRYRESTQSWSPWHPFKPYFTVSLTEELGLKTIELELDDGVTQVALNSDVSLVESHKDPSWDPETQRFANFLPKFHVGRRLRRSNWQRFMNGIASAHSEAIKDQKRALNSTYLHLVPLDEPTSVGLSYVDEDKLLAEKDEGANLISNPTFTLLRSPIGEPQDWALTGDWILDTQVSLFGHHSLKNVLPEGEMVTAVQRIEIDVPANEVLTLGLLYKTALPSNTPPLTDVDFSIELSLLYEDGDQEQATRILRPGTNDHWSLETLNVTTSKPLKRLYVVVVLEGQSGISPFPFTLGGIQLRKSSSFGSFSYGRTEPYLLNQPSTNALEPSKEVWFTESLKEFSYELIPTRISLPSAPLPGVYTRDFHIPDTYRLFVAHPDSAVIGFREEAGKIGMWITVPQELLHTFNVAFYDQGMGSYLEAEGFHVEKVRFHNNRLWAIGYFEDAAAAEPFVNIGEFEQFGSPVDGDDRLRYLLIINHLPPAVPISYLEVVNSYPLINLDINDEILELLFSDSDGRLVYYRTASEEYYSRLYYDYAYNPDRGVVWTKEFENVPEFN